MNLRVTEAARPRTLILTHPTKLKPDNLDHCTRLWKLNDSVFKDGRPFDKRLSLVEEGSFLPDAPLESPNERIFSCSGSIDDETHPPGYEYLMHDQDPHLMYELTPASSDVFAGPGFNQIFLGGGNLDFCLLKTFESLVRQKVRQGEDLQAIIPLAMVYYSNRVEDPFDYIHNSNHYRASLEKYHKDKTIGGYRVTIDGDTSTERHGSGPTVELHWFTVLKKMFASLFFPEISNKNILERVWRNFVQKL